MPGRLRNTTIIAIVATLLLSGCQRIEEAAEMIGDIFVSDEQQARVDAVHEAVLSRDESTLAALSANNSAITDNLSVLDEQVPLEQPVDRRFVNSSWHQSFGTGFRFETFTYQYVYETGRLTITTDFTGREGDDPILSRLAVQFDARASRPVHNAGQIAALAAAPAVSAFVIFTAFVLIRRTGVRLKWLWVTAILIGCYPVFTFYSHTGEWALTIPGWLQNGNTYTLQLFSLRMLGIGGLFDFELNRWTIDLAPPLGALAFWIVRPGRAKSPVSETPS